MLTNKANHHSEDETREAEYLKILAENLQSGVSILDEDMNYLFISDVVYKNVGATPDELKPGDPLSKCHELMVANGLFTPEILENQKLSAEDQIQRNAGGISEGVRLLTLGDGTTHRFIRKNLSCGKTVSIANDVSELVEKDKLLDKALVLGHAGYWSLDVATNTYTLSKSLHGFFGPDVENRVRKQGIVSVVHPDDRKSFKSALANSHKNENRFDVTARSFNHKGETRWVTTSGQIIHDAQGKVIRIQAFVRDVTQARQQAAELEKAKDEAIAASHAKSEFLANMSHEIRTPMNGILGMAELLGNSEINDRQREFISVINSSAEALLNIINDILDFSKIEAGAFELDPVPFDLKSSINDVTSLLLKSAQEKGIELIINYPTELPTNFIGDPGRIRQVITNLVGNAVKFTDTGHVTIDVSIQEKRDIAICTLEVKDTGIGISSEKMAAIFEKFTQADGSTTRVYGGTGLGLTISKHIVEMMDGRVHVESTFGEGSTFGFRMPLPIDKEAKPQAFDSNVTFGKRALIVDDIAVNRDIFTEQLASWGMETSTAIDGVDGLSKIRAAEDEGNPFDLIVLDYLMPGMDGQNFAQLISQTPTLKSPEIIMLSSCDQPVSTEELGKIGIRSYLAKPVRERRLYDTIIRVLSNPFENAEPNPAQSAATFSPVAEMPRPAGSAGRKIEVLVAEDFVLNQNVVQLMLADTDFEPIFANCGEEAVDMFIQYPGRFPLILMDVSMPNMDGFEATRAIRAYEEMNNLDTIPIIALTGHALKNDREDCLNAGMDDYLTKPVIQGDLMKMLEKHTAKAGPTARTA